MSAALRMAEDCSNTVLIVDDDHDMRESIAMLLDDEGYACVAAVNGADALDKLRKTGLRPCAILLDLMMPVMNGWQFRAAQLTDEMLRPIPVLVLTAHAYADAYLAAQMNASAFLKKPIELPRLLDQVERFCAERH